MKLLLVFLGMILSSVFIADTISAYPGEIQLTEANHVALIGEVTNESIGTVILKLEASKEPVTYLFIDSFGGNVFAGQVLVEYFATTKKNIVCVAKVAISMAHQIMQACPHRVGTIANIMMQHRMTAGVQGNPDNMAGFLAVLTKLEIQLNTMSANRIGVTIEEFFKKVNLEWWSFGKESQKLHMIDEVKHVGCSAELYLKETKKTVLVMGIFRVPVLISGCPLMPVRVDESARGLDKKVQDAALSQFIYTPKEVPVGG